MIQNKTIIRPARLMRKACSSRPLCFNTWLRTVTNIPTAAILKIKFTLIYTLPVSIHPPDIPRSAK